jgi:hypothetical protein
VGYFFALRAQSGTTAGSFRRITRLSPTKFRQVLAFHAIGRRGRFIESDCSTEQAKANGAVS